MEEKIMKFKLQLHSKFSQEKTVKWLLKQYSSTIVKLLLELDDGNVKKYYTELLNINFERFHQKFGSKIFKLITKLSEEDFNRMYEKAENDPWNGIFAGVGECDYVLHNQEYMKKLLSILEPEFMIKNILKKCSIEELQIYLPIIESTFYKLKLKPLAYDTNVDPFDEEFRVKYIFADEEICKKIIQTGCMQVFNCFNGKMSIELMKKIIDSGYKISINTKPYCFPIPETLAYLKEKDINKFYLFYTSCILSECEINVTNIGLSEEELNECNSILEYRNKNKKYYTRFDESNLFNKYMFILNFQNSDVDLENEYITPKVLSYINFIKKYSFCLDEFITSVDDINRYFDYENPKQELFIQALFHEKSLKSIYSNDEWKNYIPTSPALESYIKFNLENGLVKICDIRILDDVSAWFDSNGPKQELFDRALQYPEFFFNLFKANDIWKKYFTYTEEESKFISFILSNKDVILSNINTWFIDTIFEDISNYKYENIIFNPSKVSMINQDLFFKIYKDIPKETKHFVEATSKIGFKPSYRRDEYFNFFRENGFEGYFDSNGPTKKFYAYVLLTLDSYFFGYDNRPKEIDYYKYYSSMYSFLSSEKIEKHFIDENITEEFVIDLLLKEYFDEKKLQLIDEDEKILNIINNNIYLKNYYTFIKKIYEERFFNQIRSLILYKEDIEKYFSTEYPSIEIEKLAVENDINIYSSKEEYERKRREFYADSNGNLSPEMIRYFDAEKQEGNKQFYHRCLTKEQIISLFSIPPTELIFESALFDNSLFFYLLGDEQYFDFSFIDGNPHKWTEFYHPNKIIENYIKWNKVVRGTNLIKKKEDINKYFDEIGPKKEIIEQLNISDLNSKLFRENFDYKRLGLSDSIPAYIDFIDNQTEFYFHINSCQSIKVLDKYFDSNGPKDCLFLVMLYSDEFIVKKLLTSDLTSENLKKFIQNYDIETIFLILKEINVENFEKYFVDGNPTIEFYNFCIENYNLSQKFKNELEHANFTDESLYLRALTNFNLFGKVFNNDNWEKNYNPKGNVKTYIKYMKRYNNYGIFDICSKKIDKFFNEFGPTNAFYEEILFKYDDFNFVFEDDWEKYYTCATSIVKQYIEQRKNGSNYSYRSYDELVSRIEKYEEALFDREKFFNVYRNTNWEILYNPSKGVKTYIQLCLKNYRLFDNINSMQDIIDTFENPTKESFDNALFDIPLFGILFNDDYKDLYTKYYETTPEKISYIEFCKSINYTLINYINDVEAINIYFDAYGPKKELYDKALFDWNLLKILNESLFEKYQYSDSVKKYIKFISLRNSMIDEIKSLDDIENYFNNCGPKEELFELGLKKYEIFMILKNNYQDIESSKKYIMIFEKYDELNEYFEEKYQFEKIFESNTDIANSLNIIEINKERIKEYLKINDELFTTLNVKILDEKYKEIPEYLLQQILLYPEIQDSIVNTNISNIKLLVDILKYIYNDEATKDLDKTIIIKNIIQNLSSYSHIFENTTYNHEQIFNLITVLQHSGNRYNIRSIEDLTNKNFKLLQIQQISIDNISTYNTENLKALLLFRLYGLDINQAKFLVERYCTNIEYLKNSGIDKKYIYILIEIYSIVNNLKSDDELRFLLYVSRGTINDYKSTYLLESKIRAEFAKKYSDTLYKLKPQHNISNNPDLVQNKAALEILKNCTYNGKHPEIYMMDGDFNLQIHVLGAYRSYTRPDNFQEAWNMPKISNHGICTSYIGNNQIASARQKHPAIAFQEYDGDEMLLCGPYDLGSYNTAFASSMEKPAYFIPPNQMINNTRHTHNEIVLERKKIVDGRIKKRQPNYLVLFVDDVNNLYNFKKLDELTEEEKKDEYIVRCAQIYEETLQASIDFGLPIVIVDRLKYAKEERKKCDELLEEYKRTLDINIMKKLLIEISNNIIGCWNYFGKNLEYCDLFNRDVYNMYVNILTDFVENIPQEHKTEALEILNKQDIYSNYETKSNILVTQDEQLLFNSVNQFYLKSNETIRKQITNDFYNGLTIAEIAEKIENQEYVMHKHL